MKNHLNTLLKLGVILLLIIAAFTDQHYNFYIFLRWTVFITSIYFAFDSRRKAIFTVVIFCIFLILFNPFKLFIFEKEIWRKFDIIVSILIFLTIDWKGVLANLSHKSKNIFILIKNCFWGVLAIIAAIWFVTYIEKVNLYNEYLLVTEGVTTKGYIINAKEYEEEVEIPEAHGGGTTSITNIFYNYVFTTQSGKTINDGSSELEGIQEFKGTAIPIQVEYLIENPKINRVKDANGQCKTITEFLWRRIGLGILMLIMFSSFGFYLIIKAIKDYLIENKKIIANNQ
ncbi:MAG: DUF6804 family protein [Bacteroidota bacterium]